jgi:hypothetical protein
MKELKIDEYKALWGEEYGYQILNSDQKASVDDGKEKVDKKMNWMMNLHQTEM